MVRLPLLVSGIELSPWIPTYSLKWDFGTRSPAKSRHRAAKLQMTTDGRRLLQGNNAYSVKCNVHPGVSISLHTGIRT